MEDFVVRAGRLFRVPPHEAGRAQAILTKLNRVCLQLTHRAGYIFGIRGVEELVGAVQRDDLVGGLVDLLHGRFRDFLAVNQAVMVAQQDESVGRRAVHYHDYGGANSRSQVGRPGVVRDH